MCDLETGVTFKASSPALMAGSRITSDGRLLENMSGSCTRRLRGKEREGGREEGRERGRGKERGE